MSMHILKWRITLNAEPALRYGFKQTRRASIQEDISNNAIINSKIYENNKYKGRGQIQHTIFGNEFY